METTVNRLKLETFRKKRSKSFLPLPKWFNDVVYGKVLQHINAGEKLQACKYLCDESNKNNTRSDYGLTWAKVQICDEIELIGGKPASAQFQTVPNPSPALSNLVRDLQADKNKPGVMNSIQKQEVLRALEPFARLANVCLHNSNLNRDQIVYAYNHAQITMQDLRNIEVLIKRLTK